jgi:rubrerythrin
MEKRRRKNFQRLLDRILTAELQICQVCGKLFLPDIHNHHNQVNCSPNCTHVARRLYYEHRNTNIASVGAGVLHPGKLAQGF